MSTPKNQYKNQRKKRKKQIPQSTLKPESKKQKILAYTLYFLSIIVITLFCYSVMLDNCIRYSDENTLSEEGVCVSVTSVKTGLRRNYFHYVIELDTGSVFYITQPNATKAGYSINELKSILLYQKLSVQYSQGHHFNLPQNMLVQIEANGEMVISYDIFNSEVTSSRITSVAVYLCLIGLVSGGFFTRRWR